MSDKYEDDCRCTSDAPCGESDVPQTMLGREYRSMAHPEHVEFAPVFEPEPPHPEGWRRIDGLKKLDNTDFFVVARLYRKHVGTMPNGEDLYFVGEYVGNRRHVLDNNDSPGIVGSTWQIYLQEDADLNTPIECYRLCDLEVVDGSGTKLVQANDYNPKSADMLIYYAEEVAPKPKLGLLVEHPKHGGGEVVRVTGTGDVWYAGVEYSWPDTSTPPTEGVSVRRCVTAHNDKQYYVYGEVSEVEGDQVTVEFDNGREHVCTRAEFYQEFSKIGEMGSGNFHQVFGVERGPRRLTPKARRIGRDVRTADERILGAPSRSSVAFSAMSARNTPDSGHFVPKRKDGPWTFSSGSSFRWHRERQEAPKNEDFAPLVGRPEKVARPKKGWSYDRLNSVRERLALSPGEAREPQHEQRSLPGTLWERPEPPAPSNVEEMEEDEYVEYNGTTVLF